MKSSRKRYPERRYKSRSAVLRPRRLCHNRRKGKDDDRSRGRKTKVQGSDLRRRDEAGCSSSSSSSKRRRKVGNRAPRNRLLDQVNRIKRLPTSLFGFAHGLVARKKVPPRSAKHHACSSSSRKVVGKARDQVGQYRDLVILSDCVTYVKSLPTDLLDCTITSPPLRTNLITDQDTESWVAFVRSQLALLDELYRVTKPGGHLFYAHKVQHYGNKIFHPASWIIKSPWMVRQEIIWDKVETPDTSLQKFWPKDERIFWLRKETGPNFSLHWSTFRWGNVWLCSDCHPGHAFPIYLASAILHALHLPRGSLVFDPYGRSGTTAKACQAMKLHFLTTDADEKSVEAIRDRLKTTTKEDKYWTSMVAKQMAKVTLDLRIAPKHFLPT